MVRDTENRGNGSMNREERRKRKIKGEDMNERKEGGKICETKKE
jgi:hypothetical protein